MVKLCNYLLFITVCCSNIIFCLVDEAPTDFSKYGHQETFKDIVSQVKADKETERKISGIDDKDFQAKRTLEELKHEQEQKKHAKELAKEEKR